MVSKYRHTSRRTLLAAVASTSAVGIAGCLGDDDEATDDSPDDDDAPPVADDNDAVDHADDDDQTAEEIVIEPIVEDLSYPWGLELVPDESLLLVTERTGDLLTVDRKEGSTTSIGGIPSVDDGGQGGLLDLALHPAFPDESWLYLTYVATNDAGERATHLGRGELSLDANELESFEELAIAEPFLDGTGHFGSRVVFDGDGQLYMTSGDRRVSNYDADHPSQDRSNAIGATLRFEPDGSIPDDNPFLEDDEALDALYSYGHRNAQGMTVHPETGDIWQSEHGEEDGDELNIIEAGGNYGWPVAHYGCHYGTDDPVGEEPGDRDDIVDPVYYWECGTGGFPPAGMTFYDGDAFPAWQGDLFVGNLAGQYLGHFSVSGTDVEEQEPLLEGEGWRIRDVIVEAEAGNLIVAVDDSSAPLVRISPT